jgi:hypothetical protein
MAESYTAFQNYLSQWVDEVQSLAQDVETWAGNKNDTTPSFDYTTAQADLETAKANLVSSVETVKAL